MTIKAISRLTKPKNKSLSATDAQTIKLVVATFKKYGVKATARFSDDKIEVHAEGTIKGVDVDFCMYKVKHGIEIDLLGSTFNLEEFQYNVGLFSAAEYHLGDETLEGFADDAEKIAKETKTALKGAQELGAELVRFQVAFAKALRDLDKQVTKYLADPED